MQEYSMVFTIKLRTKIIMEMKIRRNLCRSLMLNERALMKELVMTQRYKNKWRITKSDKLLLKSTYRAAMRIHRSHEMIQKLIDKMIDKT